MNRPGRTVVAGAGVSGIRAALDLAETGRQVVLLDKAPVSGGVLLALDRQFPNDHCGMCRMLPMIDRDNSGNFCMRLGIFHKNITFLPSTEITDISGSPGDLKVHVKSWSPLVDPDLCTACGECFDVCPVSVPDELAEGLATRKAIYRSGPNTSANALSIDPWACTLCGKCADICEHRAVTLSPDFQDTVLEEVSSVIMATGVDYFDPSETGMYGYGRYPDVITSLAFERMISPCGPTEGRLIRPSDGNPAKNIAWIQCVGSRNLNLGADHCSGACCMFALKQAGLAARKGISPSIFYMDMRTFGRDWQKYLDRARSGGLRLIRCRPHSIENHEQGGLRISYSPLPGKILDEPFDLVVLSTGRDPGWTGPGFSAQEGVFRTEGSDRLLDISQSLVSASSASSRAAMLSPLPPRSAQSDCPEPDQGLHLLPVLVVGGGPAGLAASLTLTGQGVKVIVVEQNEALGGTISRISDPEAREKAGELVQAVQKSPDIQVLLKSRPGEFSGVAGNFKTLVHDREGQSRVIEHGALILAPGGEPSPLPEDISHPGIMNVFDLSRRLDDDKFNESELDSAVFIQCFETRQGDRNYCSRLCCPTALRAIEKIRRISPECMIVVFYRDMMTPGDLEHLYTRARELGALFIPYDTNSPPALTLEEGRPVVQGFDPVLEEEIRIKPDLVGLGSGLKPVSGPGLAGLFKIKTTSEGFLEEADSKWRPVDSGREGIFICGLGRNPLSLDEAVDEGRAAAQRAMRVVRRPDTGNAASVARVRPALCSMCGLCRSVCPYFARYPGEQGFMAVDPLACQGCGVCVVVCPNQATVLDN
jgi:heterodisulfide reductase subunit A-like polyferredoxin